MKKLLLIVLSSLCYFANAQDVLEVEYDVYTVYDASKTQGSVTIDNRKLSRDETIRYFTEQMKIPKPYILITNKTASNYNQKPTLNSGNSVSYSSNQGNGLYYKNLLENFYMHESVGFGMDRIIKDSIPKINWTITRDKRKVLGFDVRKATAKINKEEFTAWFATSLSFPSGPDKYMGLPGLILELERKTNDDADMVITYNATSVKEAKKNVTINQPKKGKIVDFKTYKAEMDAFFKKQQEMNSQGVDKD
ncbi:MULTISPECIES: GLPGLI family protein [unclassified Empedobacter]|uniref:GLPGLI family protein n=2 Tax=unclassified Empedobacter TaxID=2643773 RepID=UPI0025BCC92C|nr:MULTISPECIES: GLPGLI family protein [unclassified Empedobacter]